MHRIWVSISILLADIKALSKIKDSSIGDKNPHENTKMIGLNDQPNSIVKDERFQ